MIELPGPGFVWIETVLPLTNSITGQKQMVARFVRHLTLEKADLKGFAVFQPAAEKFKVIRTMDSAQLHRSAHAFPVTFNGQSGFATQPWERIADRTQDFIRPENYEYYTCIEPAGPEAKNSFSIAGQSYKLRRDRRGRLVFSWTRGGQPFTPEVQQKLEESKRIGRSERWLRLYEMASGKQIDTFSGSIAFNRYKNRWIMIIQGPTGEIWFSEADTFTGPWQYARRIISHDGYNFYNPVHHYWFDRDNGRTIFIEGTYTAFFTATGWKTPRADYNQLLYRLDLSDSRLVIPEPSIE